MPGKILIEVDPRLPVDKSHTYLGYLYIRPSTSDEAISFLRKNFGISSIYVDVGNLEIADCLDILNAGATRLVGSMQENSQALSDHLSENFKRFALLDGGNAAGIKSKFDDAPIFPNVLAPENGYTWSSKSHVEDPELLNSAKDLPKDFIMAMLSLNWNFVIRSSRLGKDLRLDELLVASLKTDRPDRLYTTLVSDRRGTSLGLVYSSLESIRESIETGRGVYQSRNRGLWRKGETSGDIQELVRISKDCDSDALIFTVDQKGDGFCHLKTATCFGDYSGLSRLEKTLVSRKQSALQGSYTSRLFNDSTLLQAKIMEEANELCEANKPEDIAAEAADLIYFALTKCVSAGVSLVDIEKNLDLKSLRLLRRQGDAKPQWENKVRTNGVSNGTLKEQKLAETVKEAASIPKSNNDTAGTINGRIAMRRIFTSQVDLNTVKEALQRPSQKSMDQIMSIVKPIVAKVQVEGDAAVLEYTHKFEKATSLTSPVLNAPFPKELMQLSLETVEAIDISFNNIRKFHFAQKETAPLRVETMPGVVCSRFSRPIESVGLYVPGGTAVLPSTALMLGIPAMVAGCKNIVLASPPRADGTITPEIVYVAHRIGAKSIVLAGGAQAVAAMAYGTQSITKVDKILGPGNQFVTAAKMLVSNDTSARVAIDMPAGPSEVLVIADKKANPAFVAIDLLSQAEHGVDSQVILIAVGLDEKELAAIENELDQQANALPRKDIIRGAIAHSVTLVVKDIDEAVRLSNEYCPEHLILQVENAAELVDKIENAGSIFIGEWTPESVGDYSAGVNHALRKFSRSFPLRIHCTDYLNSNVWICEAIFWCQPGFVHETHYQFKSYSRRSEERWRSCNAACKS